MFWIVLLFCWYKTKQFKTPQVIIHVTKINIFFSLACIFFKWFDLFFCLQLIKADIHFQEKEKKMLKASKSSWSNSDYIAILQCYWLTRNIIDKFWYAIKMLRVVIIKYSICNLTLYIWLMRKIFFTSKSSVCF